MPADDAKPSDWERCTKVPADDAKPSDWELCCKKAECEEAAAAPPLLGVDLPPVLAAARAAVSDAAAGAELPAARAVAAPALLGVDLPPEFAAARVANDAKPSDWELAAAQVANDAKPSDWEPIECKATAARV